MSTAGAAAAAASSAADWQNKLLRADKIHADLLYIHTRYKRAYSLYIYIYIYILVPLHPCETFSSCIDLASQSGNFIIFHFDKQTQWRAKEDAAGWSRGRAEAPSQSYSSARPGRGFVMHELIGLSVQLLCSLFPS